MWRFPPSDDLGWDVVTDDLVQAVAAAFEALRASGALGERRDGQRDMAVAVARAIVDRRHLVVQAGTGVGKTAAYLVPAILSGHRVVVSTSTKSLQEQVAEHHLPALQDALGRDVTWSVVKGRSSYLCQQRLTEITTGDCSTADEGTTGGGTPPRALRRLLDWAATTATGDRDEAEFEVSDAVWRRVSVRTDECPGQERCPSGGTCFAERVRAAAAEVDVVITNHHLYVASLTASQHLLPDHRVVVFDEAHQLDEAVRQTTSTYVDPARIGRIVGTAADEDVFARLAAEIAPYAGRYLGRMPPTVEAALHAAAETVRSTAAAERLAARAGGVTAQRRAHTLALIGENIALTANGEGRSRWVEGTAEQPVLRTFAADAGARQVVGDPAHRTAILTSATFGEQWQADLGLPTGAADGLTVPSPFAYHEQAVLYCAADLPDPRTSGWTHAAHAELIALINAAGGRTLALFTSWAALHAAVDAVTPHVEAKIVVQGSVGRRELLRGLRADVGSCVFGTAGLAQGTDIPGDALTLVTLDRLPFPPTHDPYFAARRAGAGQHAFREVDLRHARTMLAQIAGRLIRTRTDRGVFAVLDPRLAHADYRWTLVHAIPPMRRTRDRQLVCDFLRGCAATA
jgi:ATP-dependent DNA helicase DinG